MNESIKKLADSLGVEYTADTKETELISAIENKTAEIKAAESKMRNDLSEFRDSQAVKLIDDAIKAGQLLPSQKEDFEAFAKTNYAQCEKLLASLKKNDLTEKKINTSENSEKRFIAESKSEVTYEEVLKNPDKFIGILSEEEILKLRGTNHMYKDSPILD